MDSMTGKGIDLYEFLVEAELQHYYTSIKSELKIQTVAQLKYATDEDLRLLGLSRPETRRLRKFYDRHCPHGYLSKIKRLLQPPRRDETAPLATVSEERQGTSRPCSTGVSTVPSSVAPGSKHIIPAESISVHKQLGVGEFGIVQQGVWRNGSDRIQVAIKCLSRERMQSHPMEFLKEAAIMHAVDNVHVVRLYGVVLDTDALMLVTELAPLRSLLECLKEPALRSSFTVLTLCEFASQICSGMMYLETKRLIHRDLAARNILVFSKDKVKISDFGLSRALGVGKDYYQTNFNVNLKLPIAWCAPECISYLRFTSLSDVWAYAVTLWEMFSYGFQPWAALTGCQILEAIDEPNYQRLEQPECCPKEYYTLMLKCWQHDPLKRPKFSEIYVTLPECKPEQVQTISGTGLEPDPRREQLAYRAGEVITVLDKISNAPLWKGVAPNGKTGLFDPSHTVAYLGALPGGPPNPLANQGTTNGSSKENFMRTADRSSKRRLRTEMISSPQGDLKHTGHVGLDGAYFGDISFFSSGNVNVPRQIVAPYKPSEDLEAPLLPPTPTQPDAPILEHVSNPLHITDHQTLTYRGSGKQKPSLPSLHISIDSHLQKDDSADANLRRVKWGDVETSSETHEYHEISDEENAVPESPRFDKTYDMGPSLLDEMESVLRLLGNPRPPPSPADHEGANQRNEIRELSSRLGRSASTGKKKQASVKPISAADQRALDCAIAMANEISARSMTDLECPDPPHTPSSPSRKKFSFRFPSVGGPAQANQSEPPRANFHEEAQSIPDIQSTITEDSRLAYSSLIEQPTPPVDLQQACPVVKSATISGTLPRIPLLQMPLDIAPSRHTLSRFSSATDHAETTGDASSQLSTSPTTQETNPLRILRSKNFPAVRPRNRNAEKIKPLPNVRKHVSNENADRNSSDLDTASVPESPSYLSNADCNFVTDSAFNYSHPLLNYQNNPVPLPPRDRTKLNLAPSKRHTRKHPLIIPATNLQRTLDKVNQLTPVEDKPPLAFPNVITDVVDSKQKSSVRVEPGYVNHQEVVLGKQLKYSTQQFLDNNFTPSELKIGSDVVEYENVDMSSHDDVDCASLHFENMVESNFNSIDNFHDTSTDCSPEELDADKYTKFHDNYVENDKKKYEFCIKHPAYLTKPNELANHALFNKIRNNEINDNMSKNLPIKQIDGLKLDQETLNPFSEQSIGREERGAIDNGDMASCDVTDGMDVGTYSDQALVKTSDHVSCEDLLEFAGQKPRGRARGIESDEVRIMSKVLGPEVTSSHCLLALEFIDWNVHKAIKLARLQSVLGVPSLSLRECRAALEVSQWDVTRAARYVSTDSTSV